MAAGKRNALCERLAREYNDKSMSKKIIYLKKANNDLVGHCKCKDGRISFPPQMDCPWCGCGWLFTCMSCRKAFTFAVGVELEAEWEELAREDWKAWGLTRISKKHIASWVKDMKSLVADVKVGSIYVCIDGRVFEKDAGNVEFDGIYGSHKFERLPHAAALDDAAIVDEVLSSTKYWISHKRKRGLKAA
jgi:hypothetical protein